MRKSLRYFRITWTVFCGIACILLIVLWVRSDGWEDDLVWVQGSARNVFAVQSMNGRIELICQSSGDSVLPPFGRLQRPLGRNEKSRTRFGLSTNATLTSLRFPTWVLVTLLAAIGTSPWLKFSWRFSVRTLLIVTTLIAAVLGLIVYFAR
jgi:hypothetical protein